MEEWTGENVQETSTDAASGRGPELDEGVLDLQYVFDALAHPRRRYLLYTLSEEREWTLTELAEKVVAWEDDVPEEAVPTDDRDGMYASLLHAHVPKLVDHDVVAFSRSEEIITRGPNAEQVLEVLQNAGASLDSAQEAHARSTDDDHDGQ